jgi:class 3 adenylate cyclase
MRCSKCGSDNRQGRKFCANCGAPLAVTCPKCGVANQSNEKFCGECGAPIDSTAPLAASRAQPRPLQSSDAIPATEVVDGERKTVTALFADIKGSMELMEDLDPEEARTIIDPALKLMIEAVHRYDGYIVQSTGDGIFALFGAPVAHEDHPQRALYAALRMQEEMRRFAERLRADKGLNLQVRVGANVGDVVVRTIQTGTEHPEYSPIGHSTSLAARLQTLATPGSTVISGNMRGLVKGYFQLRGLGPTRIKGVSEPAELFEVTGLGPLRTRLQRAAGRGLTKFVGRQREMDTLRHVAEQARVGRGQIVAVMADPGVGKSRLIYEFKATSQSGWMVLEAFSVSYGKASAYLPVLDLLSQYFEIGRDDDDRKRRERVLGKVLGLDRALEDTLPYLYSLQAIGDTSDSLAQMDPQIRRRRTLDAIKRILLRESMNQPLMIIFEDLHWIDNETQALLNVLVDAIANARILRHHSLRFFGGLRERVLVRDRFRCRGCGKRAALVVHHRDRRNRTNFLVTLCVRCHVRIHRSSGLKYWFSEILVRLWHELHPNAPMQLQLSFQNVDKENNWRRLFKQTTGEILPFSSLPDARALELSGILDPRPNRIPR